MSEARTDGTETARRRRAIRPGPAIAAAAGWAMLVVALTALAYELFLFQSTGAYRVVAAGEFWFTVDVASLNLVQAVVQRYVHPYLWDPVIAGLLHWPAWSLLGGPGVVLAFGFRIRRDA